MEAVHRALGLVSRVVRGSRAEVVAALVFDITVLMSETICLQGGFSVCKYPNVFASCDPSV